MIGCICLFCLHILFDYFLFSPKLLNVDYYYLKLIEANFCLSTSPLSMGTPEFLLPGRRPSSPAAVAWFEFLLQPDFLIAHLSKPLAIPGAHQLIIQFLQQANALESANVNSSNTHNSVELKVHDPSKEHTVAMKLESNGNSSGNQHHSS